MELFDKIKNVVDKTVEILCVLMLAVMTVLVTYQVITRYVFNNPSTFSETLAQYLFVWLVMFGSALVFGSKDHLEISTIKEKLGPKSRVVVETVINIFLLVFSIVVCVFGGYLGMSRQIATMDAALGIPTGIIYSSIPICGVIMAFYAVYNSFSDYRNYKKLKMGENI